MTCVIKGKSQSVVKLLMSCQKDVTLGKRSSLSLNFCAMSIKMVQSEMVLDAGYGRVQKAIIRKNQVQGMGELGLTGKIAVLTLLLGNFLRDQQKEHGYFIGATIHRALIQIICFWAIIQRIKPIVFIKEEAVQQCLQVLRIAYVDMKEMKKIQFFEGVRAAQING